MRTISAKADYFNNLNRSEKAQIKRFILELGYVHAGDLKAHIQECGIAKRFDITRNCLNEVIAHVQPSSEE
ncbi:putative anti-restriction nuclease [Klebsiella phage vB_KpnM_BovinicusUrsus]|uniref:Putative anti-restriction nuclease n=1 Tax=Klebsiella phage vB_KpnM_BovinicusUrsus TaxID=2777352 RepID=A0A7T3TJW5_9CAUD|nr:putative anti-restriction nuclease [Klebsiella phage vB_KpnM_BovinicusUrsus]